MQNSSCQSILSTTAALWFKPDAKRLEQPRRRESERCLTSPAVDAKATQLRCRAPLSAADLLSWRDDLSKEDKHDLREMLRAQAAA